MSIFFCRLFNQR